MASLNQWLSLFRSPRENTRLIRIELTHLVDALKEALLRISYPQANQAHQAYRGQSSYKDSVRKLTAVKGAIVLYIKDLLLEAETLRVWTTGADHIPENVLYRFVECLELTSPESLMPGSEALLNSLLVCRHDLVAVHAYRALVKGGRLLESDVASKIGKSRYSEWKKLG